MIKFSCELNVLVKISKNKPIVFIDIDVSFLSYDRFSTLRNKVKHWKEVWKIEINQAFFGNYSHL